MLPYTGNKRRGVLGSTQSMLGQEYLVEVGQMTRKVQETAVTSSSYNKVYQQ